MSELNELCRLLDEAGVSYLNHRTDVTIGYYSDDPHGVIEAMDGSLQVTGLTAEQVMRALGPSIVRCRDCKHGFDEDFGYLYCGRRPGHCFETRANGFCAWGLRKGVDDSEWQIEA